MLAALATLSLDATLDPTELVTLDEESVCEEPPHLRAFAEPDGVPRRGGVMDTSGWGSSSLPLLSELDADGMESAIDAKEVQETN